MNETEIAKKVISELEAEMGNQIYTDDRIPKDKKESATLGRIGGLQMAILKIKLNFNIPL